MIWLTILLLLAAVPSWGFDAAVTRVPMNTITGLQSITFADFSEDCTAVPCAAIFVVTRAVTDNTLVDDALMSVGYTDGTNQRITAVSDNDGGSSTNSRREMHSDHIIHTMDAGTDDGLALFFSWLNNGLRIDITDAPPSAFLLTVTIMGGTGFSAKVGDFMSNATIGASTDVNTVGFTPDTVFLSGARLSTAGATDFIFSTGVAVNDGLSTQGSIGCYSRSAQTTSNPHATTSTLYALSYTDFNGLDLGIEIGGWDAQGFSATTRVATLAVNSHYLAVSFGTPEFAMVDIDTRTSVGATTHALGFRPLWGMVLGTLARAYDVDEADTDAGQCMISMWTAQGQYSNNINVQDLVTTPNTGSRSDDQAIVMGTDSGTCPVDSCFRGFVILEPTGFSLDYSTIYTDAVRKWVGFAIEDEVGVLARRRGLGILQ